MKRRRSVVALVLLLIVIAAGMVAGARTVGTKCPGDRCLWRWFSSTCAFLCPYDDGEAGPIKGEIEIPVRDAPTP